MSTFRCSTVRRKLLRLAATGAVTAGVSALARAEEVCNQVPAGRWCDAKIRTDKFASVHAIQQTPVWCWAATLEMIFRWHGKFISQRSVVEQTFGRLISAPADLQTLLESGNRTYIDDNGRSFVAESKVWSADVGVAQIDNRSTIASLRAERPLVVCNLHHMMALVGVNYTEHSLGSIVVNEAWVADPMLRGSVTEGMGERTLAPGFRYLNALEIIPMPVGQLRFMADMQVSDL